MIPFDKDPVNRFRKLLSDLRWASSAPLQNVIGKPFDLRSTELFVSLRNDGHPYVVIESATLMETIRQVLQRFGWVHTVNAGNIVVEVGRLLRQPVGVFQQVPSGPVVTAGPSDTSKDKFTYSVGQSEFEFPRDALK